MAKKFLIIGLCIGVGVIAINTLLYWYNVGFGFELGIIGFSCPSIIFTWVTMIACAIAVRRSKGTGAVISVLLMIGIHAAALLYFLVGFFNWREGTEIARLFLIQLTFTMLVLLIWIVRPILQAANKSGNHSGAHSGNHSEEGAKQANARK